MTNFTSVCVCSIFECKIPSIFFPPQFLFPFLLPTCFSFYTPLWDSHKFLERLKSHTYWCQWHQIPKSPFPPQWCWWGPKSRVFYFYTISLSSLFSKFIKALGIPSSGWNQHCNKNVYHIQICDSFFFFSIKICRACFFLTPTPPTDLHCM